MIVDFVNDDDVNNRNMKFVCLWICMQLKIDGWMDVWLDDDEVNFLL